MEEPGEHRPSSRSYLDGNAVVEVVGRVHASSGESSRDRSGDRSRPRRRPSPRPSCRGPPRCGGAEPAGAQDVGGRQQAWDQVVGREVRVATSVPSASGTRSRGACALRPHEPGVYAPALVARSLAPCAFSAANGYAPDRTSLCYTQAIRGRSYARRSRIGLPHERSQQDGTRAGDGGAQDTVRP